MTWKELKEKVEAALVESGQTEDIDIDYMDFSGGGFSEVEVYISTQHFSLSGDHTMLTVQ